MILRRGSMRPESENCRPKLIIWTLTRAEKTTIVKSKAIITTLLRHTSNPRRKRSSIHTGLTINRIIFKKSIWKTITKTAMTFRRSRAKRMDFLAQVLQIIKTRIKMKITGCNLSGEVQMKIFCLKKTVVRKYIFSCLPTTGLSLPWKSPISGLTDQKLRMRIEILRSGQSWVSSNNK